jgi:class 3 adenylate cyclase
MATGEVKPKLTAIFSADVEGYSRLMGEDELATVETLTSYKETMRKLIRQYRGRVARSASHSSPVQVAPLRAGEFLLDGTLQHTRTRNPHHFGRRCS